MGDYEGQKVCQSPKIIGFPENRNKQKSNQLLTSDLTVLLVGIYHRL